MSNLDARIAKLYDGAISKVNSEIVVVKDNKIVRKVCNGKNPNKVVAIIVRL